MDTIRASAGKERAAVPAAIEGAIEGAVRGALEAAGWEPEEGAGGTIWLNPIDLHWYDELRALAIQKAGLDPGSSDH
jgi:hypothetical protein